MTESDGLQRVQAFEAFETISSLDRHGELVRLILTEASLLTRKYRNVRRHDVPHIGEMAGLFDLLWQEVEMKLSEAGVIDDPRGSADTLPLFGAAAASPEGSAGDAHSRPAFRLQR